MDHLAAGNRKSLIDVAMGRDSADLVLLHGTWVCVQSGELVPNTDVAIKNGRVAYVGPDARHTITPETEVIDAENKFLVPGLLDGHMHVESSMLTVTEFVRAVVPHGTTGLFIDPHEIANVLGLQGVRLMAEEAARQPIHVWVEVPSCVPSAPGLETSGGEITLKDVTNVLTWEGVIGLGEMMDYPGVADGEAKALAVMDATRRAGKIIGGHYASPDLGRGFHAYAAGGAEDDHEGVRVEDAIARVRQGMKAMMRFGSAWQDVAAQAPAITNHGLDSRHFILCSDDSQAETLVNDGHMDRVVRQAISQGIPAMTALQMATLNTAEHFGLSGEIGQIAPGRWADILLVNDLGDFQAELVIARGKVVAKHGELLIELPEVSYPEWARQSIHLKRPLGPEDFYIPIQGQSGAVKVNVIGVTENQAPTKHLVYAIQPEGNEIKANPLRGLAKIAVVERHHGTGRVQVGMVTGFGFNQHCAAASTVAHDCHQMIIIGTSDEEMAIAANHLAEAGGGQVVVKDGRVIALVELPIGGLMSTQAADRVAQQGRSILNGFRECGCTLNHPNMTMSLLALVVIPELRISDKGLVDVNHHRFIPLVEELGT
jgi:adenine deaminase